MHVVTRVSSLYDFVHIIVFGRHYFQLLASSTTLAQGFYGIIKAFNWKKVSLITQNEMAFVKVRISILTCIVHVYVLKQLQMMDELKGLLSSAEIEYTERVFASTDGIGALSTDPFVS